MTLRVVVRSPAATDLLESALFIAEDNPAAARRFLDEAEKAFARLAEFPELGTPRLSPLAGAIKDAMAVAVGRARRHPGTNAAGD